MHTSRKPKQKLPNMGLEPTTLTLIRITTAFYIDRYSTTGNSHSIVKIQWLSEIVVK